MRWEIAYRLPSMLLKHKNPVLRDRHGVPPLLVRVLAFEELHMLSGATGMGSPAAGLAAILARGLAVCLAEGLVRGAHHRTERSHVMDQELAPRREGPRILASTTLPCEHWKLTTVPNGYVSI